jgi:hypothetical protein
MPAFDPSRRGPGTDAPPAPRAGTEHATPTRVPEPEAPAWPHELAGTVLEARRGRARRSA